MKFKIDNDLIAEEFFENTRILGIVAPVKDYIFTWTLNQRLGFNFRLNNSLEIQLLKKERNYFFPIFSYQVPGTNAEHFLYNNQHDGEFLLPEFRHLDFIWLIKDEELKPGVVQKLQESLNLLPGLQLVTEISAEKIKHKQHLIF
ncbi:MAG: IPExxxVDY family protein [Ferruginibacter sp.]